MSMINHFLKSPIISNLLYATAVSPVKFAIGRSRRYEINNMHESESKHLKVFSAASSSRDPVAEGVIGR